MDVKRKEEAKEYKALNRSLAKRIEFRQRYNKLIHFLNNKNEYLEHARYDGELKEDKKIFLEKWQLYHGLIKTPIKGQHATAEDCKFQFHEQVMESCHAFIYENLRAISRGETNILKPVGNFGFIETNALLSLLVSTFNFCPSTDKGYYSFEESNGLNGLIDGMGCLFGLARLLRDFLEYLNDVYFGRNAYRICVCCFQIRKEPECGKIMVGGKKTEACSKHERRWSTIKAERKRRKEKK